MSQFEWCCFLASRDRGNYRTIPTRTIPAHTDSSNSLDSSQLDSFYLLSAYAVSRPIEQFYRAAFDLQSHPLSTSTSTLYRF